jgi:serine/threonine-protein kinase
VANLGAQAAQALAHAHEMGVVHRDVKPANLLVDGQGHLWVTDFGLARAKNDTRLTMTGDLVGTLRYMSPEQALAQPVGLDHRTDLYSLGATLYELLTLEPAFNGRDRQELLRQIAQEEPRPPRQANKAVPAELETIVLKAMAKAPDERYATAQELADDLTRFLADEPIRARRPTLAQRGRKWARRHRSVVSSVAVSSLVALAVLAGAVGWALRDRAAREVRTATEVRAALEESQRAQREGKWPEAHAAARRANALLASGGGSPELRQSAQEQLADLEMVVRLEDVRIRGSAVKHGYFDSAGADLGYASAFRDYGIDVESLSTAEAAERIRARTIRAQLAAALDGWARARRWAPRKAAKSWQALLEVARAADPDPHRTALRDIVLRGDRQGLVDQAGGDNARTLPPVTLVLLAEHLAEMRGLREATVLLRQAQEHRPGDFWINHQLAYYLSLMGPRYGDDAIRFYTAAVAIRPDSPGARLNLGVALGGKGRNEEALAAFEHAIARKPDYAEAHCNRGKMLWQMRRHDEGEQALRRALELKPDLAEAHGNLGIALFHKGRLDEAIAAQRKAIELFRRARRWGAEMGSAYLNAGLVLARKGRPHEAVAALRKAVELRPKDANAHDNLGKALWKVGRLNEAVAAYQRAIALTPDYAEAHCNLGVALGGLGRSREALAAYRRAIALRPDLLTAHFNLGIHLTDNGQIDEAITAFHEAIDLRPDYPMPHYDLGRALWMKGRIDEAVASYRRAIALRPDYAEAHCNLGHCLRQQGKVAQALVAMKRGHELGSPRKDWPYPSAQWARECERLDKLATRLPAILQGKAPSAGAAETAEQAQLCYLKKFYVASARLYARAFTASPKLADDLPAAHRYHAACAAALAGCGKGDAGELTEKDRAGWRRQALTWLRADLALRARQLESGKREDRRTVWRTLYLWQEGPDLMGLRSPSAVARLSADERDACQQFWAEVKALLTKARADG